MAFALLTSMAPIYSLYASFFPVVLYMLFGTGTFAAVSLMTGSVVVEQLVPTPLQLNSSTPEAADFEAHRIGVASAVALRDHDGFLSTYLSEPIVKAFTSAAAFHVTISQLQSILGLQLLSHTGPFSLFKTLVSVIGNLPHTNMANTLGSVIGNLPHTNMADTLVSVIGNLPHTNMAELLISLVCLSILVPVKAVNVRFQQSLRTPIPVEILTLSALFTSLVVLIVLLLIGSLFYFLSKAVWLVTWLSAVVLNVNMGLAIGVVFSMMTVICHTEVCYALTPLNTDDTDTVCPVNRPLSPPLLSVLVLLTSLSLSPLLSVLVLVLLTFLSLPSPYVLLTCLSLPSPCVLLTCFSLPPLLSVLVLLTCLSSPPSLSPPSLCPVNRLSLPSHNVLLTCLSLPPLLSVLLTGLFSPSVLLTGLSLHPRLSVLVLLTCLSLPPLLSVLLTCPVNLPLSPLSLVSC
ncbi:unnamed protein product [Coregonus sp. 'balchen']|nr:unnamed protein product [Coregonus sp. 'balchen']